MGLGRFRRAMYWTVLVLAATLPAVAGDGTGVQKWMREARIAAYGLKPDNAELIVREATRDRVNAIEVDNDIPGRYESLLNPNEKLEAIRKLAQAAHKAGKHAFVYIAGLECITADAGKTRHTMAKEHPDWLQRKLTGEPAVFGGGTAFWIRPGDEDVWISPYAPEWRRIYMERVRQIAATGIDGIYVDIPYWMTHFQGWEDSWASFDDYTVAAFQQKTGLDARKDLKLGDFSDVNFRKWVDFRIQTLTDFMHEIDRNAKWVNPRIATIAEIYPGIEEEVVRVGADPYQMYAVLDSIAHEYEFGEGDHTASSRSPLEWFKYQVGMAAFRAFASGKPTWILNYSWDGDATVDAKASMQNLAMSQLMAGANFWDARGHVTSGSNDVEERQRIFGWTEKHSEVFYAPRKPVHPVGVYFSPETRNFFAEKFVASFRGVMILLMQRHIAYQVVTPRDLAGFTGETLVLPDVRVLNDDEKAALRDFAGRGKRLLINGFDATGLADADNIVRLAQDPGERYMASLQNDFDHTSPEQAKSFLDQLKTGADISVEAAPSAATHIAFVNGSTCVFFANFTGLRGHENAKQVPLTKVQITLPQGGAQKLHLLPFLGEGDDLEAEPEQPGLFRLPPIQKGAVACIKTASPADFASGQTK